MFAIKLVTKVDTRKRLIHYREIQLVTAMLMVFHAFNGTPELWILLLHHLASHLARVALKFYL
jgi:hypothetical protein